MDESILHSIESAHTSLMQRAVTAAICLFISMTPFTTSPAFANSMVAERALTALPSKVVISQQVG